MMRYLPLLLLLTACPSSRPVIVAGDGEEGLADLRRELRLHPVVGHVQRFGDEDWLVHDATGTRLVRIEEPSEPKCSRPLEGQQLAFEGSPGAVLALDDFGAWVYRYNATLGCSVIAGSLVYSAPKLPELVSIGTGAPEASVNHTIGPVTVELGEERFVLRRTSDGKELRARDDDHHCTYSAHVNGAIGSDDAVTLVYTRDWTTNAPGETCEETTRDGYEGDEIAGTAGAVYEIRADGTVIDRETFSIPPLFEENDGTSETHVDLPGGAVFTLAMDFSLQMGREGHSYSNVPAWFITPKGGERVSIADGRAKSGARERGLKELRKYLRLEVPRGRIENGWLVYEQQRLVQLPTAWDADAGQGKPLLFQGSPGAALVFDGDDVRVAQMHDGKLRWANVFVQTIPDESDGELLLSNVRDERVSKPVTTPHGPAVITLDRAGAVLTDERGQDAYVAEFPTLGCAGKVRQFVHVTRPADGSVVLRLDVRGEVDTIEDSCDGKTSFEVVEILVLPAQGEPYLVYGLHGTRDSYGEGSEMTTRLLRADQTAFVFNGTRALGPYESDWDWSWGLVGVGGVEKIIDSQ